MQSSSFRELHALARARDSNKTPKIIVEIHFDKYYSVYSCAIDTCASGEWAAKSGAEKLLSHLVLGARARDGISCHKTTHRNFSAPIRRQRTSTWTSMPFMNAKCDDDDGGGTCASKRTNFSPLPPPLEKTARITNLIIITIILMFCDTNDC